MTELARCPTASATITQFVIWSYNNLKHSNMLVVLPLYLYVWLKLVTFVHLYLQRLVTALERELKEVSFTCGHDITGSSICISDRNLLFLDSIGSSIWSYNKQQRHKNIKLLSSVIIRQSRIFIEYCLSYLFGKVWWFIFWSFSFQYHKDVKVNS